MMAEKDFNDPDKDYGLPKVEIKTIAQSMVPAPPPAPQEGAPKETTPEAAASTEPAPKKMPDRMYTAAAASTVDKAKQKLPVKEETGKRSSWVWVLVILAIGVGAWAYFAYFQDQEVAEQPAVAETAETPAPAAPPPPREEAVEEPVPKIGLTEIRSRAESPRYFVVVGSFVDEGAAKDFSVNLHQKEMNTFLVYPYGDVSNYRLAVGHFTSFDQALTELNRVKGDFKEDLWVLKY